MATNLSHTLSGRMSSTVYSSCSRYTCPSSAAATRRTIKCEQSKRLPIDKSNTVSFPKFALTKCAEYLRRFYHVTHLIGSGRIVAHKILTQMHSDSKFVDSVRFRSSHSRFIYMLSTKWNCDTKIRQPLMLKHDYMMWLQRMPVQCDNDPWFKTIT